VILGGIDGDSTAAKLMKDGYVDATGVQDLFYEAQVIMDSLLAAIAGGEKTPEKWIEDAGFALTQDNITERATDMWGFKLLFEK
jgi:inositol transport system substrate-binding protein